MNLKIEVEREDDGRWIADVIDLPGCMVYGQTQDEALAKAKAHAFRVMAHRIEHGEPVPPPVNNFFPLHEPVGFLHVASTSGRVAPHRLDDKTSTRHFSSDSHP